MIVADRFQTNLLNADSITYKIILPSAYQKTLYWLHGYRERSNDIICHSDLEMFAEKHQIAVVLPDIPDTYYLDQPWNKCYTEQFLISEFIPAIRQKYNLSLYKEDTIIAGASMGGFGSLLLGSHHPELFGKIVCISGAFIIDDILIGNPEVIGNAMANFSHFQNLFGDIPSLADSIERNPALAAIQALENQKLPSIFIACGNKDMLFSRNEKIRDLLKNHGADVTWKEIQGGHDWKCFNSALSAIADAFLEN